jgi:hypothetical protein
MGEEKTRGKGAGVEWKVVDMGNKCPRLIKILIFSFFIIILIPLERAARKTSIFQQFYKSPQKSGLIFAKNMQSNPQGKNPRLWLSYYHSIATQTPRSIHPRKQKV